MSEVVVKYALYFFYLSLNQISRSEQVAAWRPPQSADWDRQTFCGTHISRT